jgi:transcription elongation factor Elf1
MIKTYICPVCFKKVKVEILVDNYDNIKCNNCENLLKLEYVGNLLPNKYLLVKK